MDRAPEQEVDIHDGIENTLRILGHRSKSGVTITREFDRTLPRITLPAGEMNQLGSRFYRASNAVNLGITGTGLGLRIVQAIVENHQGSVELSSAEGRGTTARVRLPLQSGAGPTLTEEESFEQLVDDHRGLLPTDRADPVG